MFEEYKAEIAKRNGTALKIILRNKLQWVRVRKKLIDLEIILSESQKRIEKSEKEVCQHEQRNPDRRTL